MISPSRLGLLPFPRVGASDHDYVPSNFGRNQACDTCVTPMRGLVAVCVVSGILLMGCGDPDTERATEPQEGSPDLSTLQIAVNPEYHQAQKSGMSGSGFTEGRSRPAAR